VSAHADVLGEIVTALATAAPAGCPIVQASSEEQFRQLARTAPAIGPVYAGRTFEDPKVKTDPKQASEWGWDVFYMGRLPGPGVTTGTDIFSLLEAGLGALKGLKLTSITGAQLKAVDERLVDILPGALLYVQSFEHWRAAA